MNPFWTGFLLGWVLFIPSVVALWLIWQWVCDMVEHPILPVSRNAGLRYYRANEDVETANHFLEDVGFRVKHLGGRWYWISRAKG